MFTQCFSGAAERSSSVERLGRYVIGYQSRELVQKLLLHARPEYNKPYAGYQRVIETAAGICAVFSSSTVALMGRVRHFLLAVIVEIRVDEPNYGLEPGG